MVSTLPSSLRSASQSAAYAEADIASGTGQRVKCRSCSGHSFGEVLNLGPMPLVNNLLTSPDEPCPRFPLKVVFCRKCSLAQLTETPQPQAMFNEYLYFSGQSQTMVKHAGGLVRRFVQPGQRVVEIASNDGYLLKQAQDRGAIVVGVDPAKNIAAHAMAAGVPTRCEYFNADAARDIARHWGQADVIFANNVLAHVPDPNEIAAGIKALLASGGTAHVEVPSLVRMVDSGAFDTIYHEHQCYFSLNALKSLFNRHDLKIINVETIEIHGGSLHLQIAHNGSESAAETGCLREHDLGIVKESYYRDFSLRVEATRSALDDVMSRFASVAACGAAAKGVVLLNTFALDHRRIPWIIDVSPHKQGFYVPGTLQKIEPPKKLLDEMPDAAVILPWNIKDEIIQRNDEYRRRGGQFIVPLPQVTIVR